MERSDGSTLIAATPQDTSPPHSPHNSDLIVAQLISETPQDPDGVRTKRTNIRYEETAGWQTFETYLPLDWGARAKIGHRQ